MSKIFSISLKQAVKNHPKIVQRTIDYGTAGFRTKGSDLDSIAFRMGLLAALRSKNTNGSAIGVMITASHNPEEDNGVKLVDPLGEMLEPAWEKSASFLSNVTDDKLEEALNEMITLHQVDLEKRSNVFVGSDTRASSPVLVEAAIDGAKVLEAVIKDFGYLTTPQLHFLVRCTNTNGAYGEATEEGYYKKLGNAFINLCNMNLTNTNNYIPKIKLDGANGVGALKMKIFETYIQNETNLLQVELCNDGKKGRLNHLCGADYVKIQQKVPEGMEIEHNLRCLSFDGDADRIIYFYVDSENVFHMLDGDKIATLVTGFIKDLVKKSGLKLNILVVQTAYANGSSTNYISNVLKVPVACVPTGVKHLHHKAQEADIGIYFEANGHGTVLFNDNAIKEIKKVACQTNSQCSASAKRLLCVIDVINQTVGDAISDMLLVETILRAQNWSVAEWDAMYKDLPNRQLKVVVKDRNAISTTDAERKCVKPVGLQQAIDNLVEGHPNWRAFVRPSGTEDIVRVYAEANSTSEADNLAYKVSKCVYDLAAGLGPAPTPNS